MAVTVTPWAIDGNTHPAAEARRMMCALLTGALGTFVTSPTATDGAHGVAVSGAFTLKVEANGTPNMSVNVHTGSAFVRSGEAADQTYHVYNDGTVNLAIAAADATNPRRDLIILQVRDSNFSGANDDARLFVVQGTPAASPADPSLAATPTALVLARIQVNAADTSIVAGDITDLRVAARSWSRPLGEVAQILIGAGGPSGIAASVTDLTFGGAPMSVTFAALAGRKYKITGSVRALQNTSTGINELSIRDGSNTVLGKSTITATAASWVQHHAIARVTPAAGSVTYKLSMSTTAGTTDPFGAATQPMTLIVEDIGGTVA